MQFANEHLGWLLSAVPAVFIVLWAAEARRRKLLSRFVERSLEDSIIARSGPKPPRFLNRSLIITAAVLCVVLALLRPQWGFTWKESRKKGVDIVVAVDVSESMLAEDVSPSRLVRARREIEDLLQELRGDRVALVAFSGAAFIETPLTLDYGTFRLFLESLDTSLIPVKGTNIEAALVKSFEALGISELDEKLTDSNPARSRAVILITDGEEHLGELANVAEIAQKHDIALYVIGIGTLEGAPIPAPDGYKKDKEGGVIITRLRPEILRKIASESGGIYVQSISSTEDVMAVYGRGIKKNLVGQNLEGGRSKVYHEYFQWPLLVSLLLLVCGPWGRLIGYLRSPKKMASGIVCLLLAAFPQGVEADVIEMQENLGQTARELYQAGKFDESLKEFSRGQKRWSKDYRMALGQGANQYRLERFDEARDSFFSAAKQAQTKEPKAKALYNAANSLVQLGQYQEAISAYQESLKLIPDDLEAKDNLEYVKRLLKEQKKQQDKKEKKQQKDKKQDSNNREQEQNRSSQSDQQHSTPADESASQSSSADSDTSGGQQSSEPGTSDSEQSSSSEASGGSRQDDPSQSTEDDKQVDLEPLLESIEENREPLIDFRRQKARKQSVRQGKDW